MEKTKRMVVTVSRLHYAVQHDMIAETVVVRVPEGVSEDSVKEFIEENEHLHPWDKLAPATDAFVGDNSDLHEVDVRMASDDVLPHFVLDWDGDRGALTLCDRC